MTQLQDDALYYLRLGTGDPDVQFRSQQLPAISQLVEQRPRLLLVQRTGWGKSIVYFITTRLLRNRGYGPTILISPLLSLMRNQIVAAERMGLNATSITSDNSDDWDRIRTQLQADTIDVLLISPERLANPYFQTQVMPILGGERIGLFVIDEAHCISDWGHDFRPDYQRIVQFLNMLPDDVPVLATTATADDRVIDDIRDQLGEDLQVIRGELARESLRLQTITLPKAQQRLGWLAETLPTIPESGIIYTLTVRDAEQVARWLQMNDINALEYHGQLDTDERQRREAMLLNNEVKALVATTALGMGFDKPDLGFVIHYQRPRSVIHYYQQIGRAGRALPCAYAILLAGEEDDRINDYFIQSAFPPEEHVEEVLGVLRAAPDGLTRGEIEQRVNISVGKITSLLRKLNAEDPRPIVRNNQRWYATDIDYKIDHKRIIELTQHRIREQERMLEYLSGKSCLMAFLEADLGVPDPVPCGACAVCLNTSFCPTTCTPEMENEAKRFLYLGDGFELNPRKVWPAGGVPGHGWAGKIKPEIRFETGRALGIQGDSGWGWLTERGKFEDGVFDPGLVQGAARMIERHWKPDPYPAWVTCVPSFDHPNLVPDFARELAARLQIPFHPVVEKIRQNTRQNRMKNSIQQVHNLDGAFRVSSMPRPDQPVLLVDDLFDSGWTMTVIAALLRESGAGPVYPFALATMPQRIG